MNAESLQVRMRRWTKRLLTGCRNRLAAVSYHLNGRMRCEQRKLLAKISSERVSEIVFVCQGNVCRSAYAEHALRKLLHENGLNEIAVSSVGLLTDPGKPADDTAAKIAQLSGVSLAEHRTRRADLTLLQNATLIFYMEPAHQSNLAALLKSSSERSFPLGMLSIPEEAFVISDPFGRQDSEYHTSFRQIDVALSKLVKGLRR